LIVGWCGQFLFFVVPCQFSLDIGEWPENQILIPDWTYFHCPGTTLPLNPKSNDVKVNDFIKLQKRAPQSALDWHNSPY